MTVLELRRRMVSREFLYWSEFYLWEDRQREAARKSK